MGGKKTYTLTLNSAITTNRSGAGIGSYTYYVNWGAILPKEVQKYDVSFVFRSAATTTLMIDTVSVSATFGSRTVYDQTQSQSSILGAIIPKSYVTTTANAPRFYYESSYTDDSGFIAYYPSDNSITVNIVPINGGALSGNFPNYMLQLCFTEIEE